MTTALTRNQTLLFVAMGCVFIVLRAMSVEGLLPVLLKPLPILLLAWVAWRNLRGRLRAGITAALLFSALGDVLLALQFPGQFVSGLGAFLIAQLIYTYNFLREAEWRAGIFSRRIAPLIAAAVALAVIILPLAAGMQAPVAVYLCAITAMAVCAAAVSPPSGVLFAGALAFMLSDSLIAINKFVQPFVGSDVAIMVTYYLAQLLIVSGLLRRQAAQQAGSTQE
ncbi:lysoplasmalogenase [Biformimicrobium ophioploci]|uniref:Lysoplasmalogenase n=1 Tax=Biformimicrobium ophioploci TaxID=3036711 RepID=A0ABQ6M072_9GAMM|nr:lysoplasmalogenase [Microbulbifer sp. NKW57]GMG87759.1 lysoplasmalogenase [Microbulbifer sp. NKW57]